LQDVEGRRILAATAGLRNSTKTLACYAQEIPQCQWLQLQRSSAQVGNHMSNYHSLSACCLLLLALIPALQNLSSPGVFVSTFGIVALALASAFLA
jgi:hypothetical protein